jgi:hypothetical protein
MIVAISAGIGSLSSGFIFAEGDIFAVSITGLILSLVLLGVVAWFRIGGRPAAILTVPQD